MAQSNIAIEARGGVLRVALNRPQVLNALTFDLLDELADALTGPAAADDVRAVVLTGNGRAFCAGADLAATTLDVNIGSALDSHYHPVVRAIVELPKPVIAGVNGVAAGAGLSLAAACDVRYAAPEASFALGFTGIGLALDAGASHFLPRLIGHGRTFELALTNRRLSAVEAFAIGLVERVLETGDSAQGGNFDEALLAAAALIAEGPTAAYGLVKRELQASHSNPLTDQLALEAACQSAAAQTHDASEGVSAFAGKRRPQFGGK